jgi:ABC-2 type transport system permease protein
VLTWVVPFACVSYYPGLLLLGRPEAQPWMAGTAPLAAAGMVAVASFVWRLGLARYQGTGH